MAKKFKHPIYLPEEEISNLLEELFHNIHQTAGQPYKIIREHRIGSVRPDFIIVTKNLVEVIEVKQTANWSALRQVCFYKKIVDQHVMDGCFRDGRGYPKTIASLYAINFDHELIDVCWSLSVDLTKIVLESKNSINLDDVFDYSFESVHTDEGLTELLRDITVRSHV